MYPVYPLRYKDIYNAKYKEIYGNHFWVDKELDCMYLTTEEDDDPYKNHHTFDYYDEWDLNNTWLDSCIENQYYKNIDINIESNSLFQKDEEYGYDNNETFSDCSFIDYYNLSLNFYCVCFDKYLESLCNINICVEEDDIYEYSKNRDTFEFDRFSPIYEIV
jgi:hypothetical protein